MNFSEVPEKIRKSAELICERFCITGVCDAMYLCNLIAYESGNGDGNGYFKEEPVITRYLDIARNIQYAYRSLITYAEAAEVAYIMEHLAINPVFAIPSLKEAKKRYEKELEICKETNQIRIPYLRQLIAEVEAEIAVLEEVA